MAERRIPGVPADTERALLKIIADQDARIAALGAVSTQRGVATANFSARPGEFIAAEPPTAGITCTLPAPAAILRNAQITIAKLTAGPIRFVCTDGKVNTLASSTMGTVGLCRLTCDGATGWFTETFDVAFGSTRGSILIRGANGWQLLTPGAVSLPLVSAGAGADPAYTALVNAGISASAAIALTKLAAVADDTTLWNIAGSSAPAAAVALANTAADGVTYNATTHAYNATRGGRSSVTTLPSPTVTNATTVITAASFTVPAGVSAVGQVWKARCEFEFIGTAAPPILRCDLAIGGSLKARIDVTPIANNGTYSGWVEAYYTIMTTAELRCSIHCRAADNLQAELWGGSDVETGASPITVANAQAITLEMSMLTAVLANTLTVPQGWVERVF
jgi:hypothetical protein